MGRYIMTDPAGSVFISYRRSSARPAGNREAKLVRDALRNVGIPTWRDLDDLEHEPTEGALIEAIEDPSLAGAILLISPEVEMSPVVRRVEALRIFRRHAQYDGFWVIPVLIGVDYGEADLVLGSPAGFQELERWNMHKVKGETLTIPDGRDVGRLAVEARLQAICKINGDSALSIGVFARRPPGGDFSLVHDFSMWFEGRDSVDGAYANFENGLLDGASSVLARISNPGVVGSGMAPLPLGVLMGSVYSPRAGFEFSWVQPVEGHNPQHWSFELPYVDFQVKSQVAYRDPESEELVVAVGVSANIEQAVSEFIEDQRLNPRACMHFAPVAGSYAPGCVLTPTEGASFVLSVIRKVRQTTEELGMPRTNLHLFLACPLAMAVLLGQKLNTFSVCHLYEHNPQKHPSYARVHTFQPSSLVYN